MTSDKSDSFDLVIFDCDGVLVDSEPIANFLLVEMLKDLGLSFTLEDMYRDFMGRSMSTCLQLIEDRLGRSPSPGFVAELNRRTAAALSDNLSPVAGIEHALDEISIPCCVASSGDREKMRLTLGLTGLLGRFDDNLFSVTQVARGKPHPDVFLYAAEQMAANPSRTAVVEDTEVGVHAGMAAGMTVFGYAALTDPKKLADAGAIVFDSMERLPTLLHSRDLLCC